MSHSPAQLTAPAAATPNYATASVEPGEREKSPQAEPKPSQPGQRQHQVQVVGGLAVAHQPVGLPVPAGGAPVHDLPALARLLDEADRLHERPALAGPVAGQIVDVQRPEAARAVVPVVPVGVGGHRCRAVPAPEAGVLRSAAAHTAAHGSGQGTNGSTATTSTVMSLPFGAW